MDVVVAVVFATRGQLMAHEGGRTCCSWRKRRQQPQLTLVSCTISYQSSLLTAHFEPLPRGILKFCLTDFGAYNRRKHRQKWLFHIITCLRKQHFEAFCALAKVGHRGHCWFCNNVFYIDIQIFKLILLWLCVSAFQRFSRGNEGCASLTFIYNYFIIK